MFMDMKGRAIPELDDINSVQDLAFMVDITGHLNFLNVKLQDRNILVTDLYKH